jgi:hypothetical protein
VQAADSETWTLRCAAAEGAYPPALKAFFADLNDLPPPYPAFDPTGFAKADPLVTCIIVVNENLPFVREQTAEIGVMVVEAERHQLAGHKAGHLVGYYDFEVLDLERLFSFVPCPNTRALAFNRRCGLVPTNQASKIYY